MPLSLPHTLNHTQQSMKPLCSWVNFFITHIILFLYFFILSGKRKLNVSHEINLYCSHFVQTAKKKKEKKISHSFSSSALLSFFFHSFPSTLNINIIMCRQKPMFIFLALPAYRLQTFQHTFLFSLLCAFHLTIHRCRQCIRKRRKKEKKEIMKRHHTHSPLFSILTPPWPLFFLDWTKEKLCSCGRVINYRKKREKRKENNCNGTHLL